MYKNFTIGVLAVICLALGVVAYAPQSAPVGMLPNYQSTLTNQASLTSGKVAMPAFSLGPITVATSATTTAVTLPKGLNWGMALGDQCAVELTTATSTFGYSSDAFITAINATSATATVTFFNGTSTVLNLNAGTLKVNCNHF